jgi:N-acetyl sugar amidotransferase
MILFPAPGPIDPERFRPDLPVEEREVLYGLPVEIRFCKTCVISNQRPNSTVEFANRPDSEKTTIRIGDDGICDACRVAAAKRGQIDWEARRARLVELCDRYRRDDGRYDCLVPGSGGKDSFYAAHVLKHEFGMHPLTVTWAPHIYTDWGWHNFQAWIHAGFDNYLHTPNGRTHRLLTRLAVENLLHPFQPFVLGQKNLAPKMAELFELPLVLYGENEAEYGNPIEDTGSARRDWSYYSASNPKSIFLGGSSIADITGPLGVPAADLQPYLPADPQRLEDAGVQVHYLGYYLRWHPQSAYYYAVENGGFEAAPERTPGTYSKYNSIDDRIDDLHYYTTYIKFGIGRATYDASQEIRSGDINFEEGVALVRRFDGEFPERFIDEILAYLSIPRSEFGVASRCFDQPVVDREWFDRTCDRFRSPHLWMLVEGEWRLRATVDGARGAALV